MLINSCSVSGATQSMRHMSCFCSDPGPSLIVVLEVSTQSAATASVVRINL